MQVEELDTDQDLLEKEDIKMPKNNALQKIESHEKLCRIMQKLTHKKIHSIEERVKRLEKILVTCSGALIAGMAFLIYTLISHLAL